MQFSFVSSDLYLLAQFLLQLLAVLLRVFILDAGESFSHSVRVLQFSFVSSLSIDGAYPLIIQPCSSPSCLHRFSPLPRWATRPLQFSFVSSTSLFKVDLKLWYACSSPSCLQRARRSASSAPCRLQFSFVSSSSLPHCSHRRSLLNLHTLTGRFILEDLRAMA